MKLNSTPVKGATLIALIAGLTPALMAHNPSHDTTHSNDHVSYNSSADADSVDTSRDGRAQRRPGRPGHNSNTPGHVRLDNSTADRSTSLSGETDRDSRAMERERPGHNSNTLGVASSSSASGAFGTTAHDDTNLSRDPFEQQPASSHLRKTSANELTGMDVKNTSGESLGKIKDFVIDSNSGQVVYAVVGSGGIAGIGEKLRAVPVQALKHSTSGERENLTLDIDSSRWAQAPRFSQDRLSSLQADQEGRSTFQYYGQEWRSPSQSASMNNPVRTQGSQSGTTSTSQTETQSQAQRSMSDQRLALATDLIGKNIRSSGQTVGTVDDVILQLNGQNQTAAALLDPNDDFAGTDQKYLIPLSRVSMAEGEVLTTTLTRSDFSSARVADAGSWASSGASDSVYLWQTDRQMDRRTDSALSTSTRGAPPIAAVREAIQKDSSIAANQTDIRVEPQGEKLVLRGTVLNEDTKEKIEDRAEEAAQGWDIDNQLTVAATEE